MGGGGGKKRNFHFFALLLLLERGGEMISKFLLCFLLKIIGFHHKSKEKTWQVLKSTCQNQIKKRNLRF